MATAATTDLHTYHTGGIPTSLKAVRSWLVWRKERVQRNGKMVWTKVPYQADAPTRPAKSNDPATWAAFEDAVAAAQDGKTGIGLVVTGELVGIDLDGCRNPESGEIAAWARSIVAGLDTYVEVSPSGNGLRLFATGAWTPEHYRSSALDGDPLPPHPSGKVEVEVYPEGSPRYLTVTGRHVDGTPSTVEARPQELAALARRMFGAERKAKGKGKHDITMPAPDAEPPPDVLERLMKRDRFAATWRRERTDLSDQTASGYDLALASAAVAAGCDDPTIATLLVAWRREHGEDTAKVCERADYLKETLRKAHEGNGRAVPPPRPVVKCMAAVAAESVQWLWRGWLPCRTLVLLAGKPGEGKSTIGLDFAARVSRGWTWPDASDGAAPGNVLILSAEDSPSATIRPRLDAAGADVARIFLLTAVSRTGHDGEARKDMPSLADDLPAVEAAAAEIGNVKLLLVDPLSAYLGAVDSHRDASVRSVLAPLQALAERVGACVLAIMHLRKSGGGDALDRVSGSGGFVAAARSAILVTHDDANPERRLFLSTKSNLGPRPDGLTFTLAQHPDSEVAVPTWGAERITRTADEVLAARDEPHDRECDTAAQFLRELLSDGPIETSKVKREARSAGVAYRALQKAAAAVGVKRAPGDYQGPWFWRMP